MPGVQKPASTAKKPTTNPSANKAKNPVTPENPPAPVPEPDPPAPVATPFPTTPGAARALLVAEHLLGKSDVITPGSLVQMLMQVARHAHMHPVFGAIITAIALITPDALDHTNLIRAILHTISGKLDKLEESTQLVLENTDPAREENTLEGKVDQMLSAVGRVITSAEKAEKVAEESHHTLTAFVDAQSAPPPPSGWVTVNAQNRTSHKPPPLPDQSRAFAAAQAANKSNKPSKPSPTPDQQPSLPVEVVEEIRAKGATVLVQPDRGVNDDGLAKLDARGLTLKATLAYDAAWRTLAATSFPEERGLKGMPRVVFKAAERIPTGGIIYCLENRDQAAFLCEGRVAKAFEEGFGCAKLKGQRVELFMESADCRTWHPEDEVAIRALERENGLESGDILTCCWVKPEHRRHPQQKRAVVKLSLRSEDTADRLIASQGTLECTRVRFRRVEEEPTRCLKCQRYGHRAVKCKATRDYCSQCGQDHRSANCPDKTKIHCVSCDSSNHASWDRRCPIFKEECERLNIRKPENRRKFFNPSRAQPNVEVIMHARSPAPSPPSTPRRTRTMGDIVDAKPGTLHAYLQRSSKPVPPPRSPDRKERDGSEPWDCESVITAPRKGTTPSSTTPLVSPLFGPPPTNPDVEFPGGFPLRAISFSETRPRAVSVSSSASDDTIHSVSPSRRAASALKSTRSAQ